MLSGICSFIESRTHEVYRHYNFAAILQHGYQSLHSSNIPQFILNHHVLEKIERCATDTPPQLTLLELRFVTS